MDIGGKPMIQHVYEACLKSRLADTVGVATDDGRIREAIEAIGGKVWMTDASLPAGTDRVAARAQRESADIYLNVQGDEPFIESEVIDATIQCLEKYQTDMASAYTPLLHAEELENRSVVKVLVGAQHKAIYFSRLAIPYSREQAHGEFISGRHLGIYAYRREALLKVSQLPVCALEKAESLEQLRALYHGMTIAMAKVQSQSIGIDTPEDLAAARARSQRNV